jgi:DedD protein
MAEPVDINVDELRRRARRRLVGAVVLALGVAVVVPMLLETEQKPLGEDVSVKIPPIDEGKFVNRLNDSKAPTKAAGAPAAKAPDATSVATPSADATARTSKYDTRIPEAPPAPSVTPDAGTAPATAPAPASNAKDGDAEKANQATPSPPAPPTLATPSASAADKVPVEKAVAAPDKPAVDKAASAVGVHREGFAVQLAAFADDKGANSLAGRLKRAGYAAYTEPLKTSKGTLWRVRVGPYPSREAAVAARDKLKTEGQNGIVAAIK